MFLSLSALYFSQALIGVDVRDKISRVALENVLARKGMTFTQVGSMQILYVVNGREKDIYSILDLELPRNLFSLSYSGRKFEDAQVPKSPGIIVSERTTTRFAFDIIKVLKLSGEPRKDWRIGIRPVGIWIDLNTHFTAYDIFLSNANQTVRVQALPKKYGGFTYHRYQWPHDHLDGHQYRQLGRDFTQRQVVLQSDFAKVLDGAGCLQGRD